MGTWDSSHWLKDFSTTQSHQQSRSWGAWHSNTHLFTQLHIKKWMPLVLPPLQGGSFASHGRACLPSHLPAFRWPWHSLAVTSLSLVSLSPRARGLLQESVCVADQHPRARNQWHCVVGSSGKRNRSEEGRCTTFSFPFTILCWHRGSHPTKSPAAASFKTINGVFTHQE